MVVNDRHSNHDWTHLWGQCANSKRCLKLQCKPRLTIRRVRAGMGSQLHAPIQIIKAQSVQQLNTSSE